jgi:hypothetical protein
MGSGFAQNRNIAQGYEKIRNLRKRLPVKGLTRMKWQSKAGQGFPLKLFL